MFKLQKLIIRILIFVVCVLSNQLSADNLFNSFALSNTSIDLSFRSIGDWKPDIRYIPNNSLLSNSIFAKLNTEYFHLVTENIIYKSEYGAGMFFFPETYSSFTAVREKNAIAVAARTYQEIAIPSFLFPDLFANTFFLANFGGLPEEGIINGYTWGIFSVANIGYQFKYHCNLLDQSQVQIGVSDGIRTAPYLPISLFRNTDLSIELTTRNMALKYVYPINYQYIRQNYPYQDQRFEWRYHHNFLGIHAFYEYVVQKERSFGSLGCLIVNNNYDVKSVLTIADHAISGSISFNFDQKSNQNNRFTLQCQDYFRPRQIQEQTKDYTLVYKGKNESLTLGDLATVIKTPQEAVEYVYYNIDYSDVHNGLGGLFKMYSPDQVFTLKQGNCHEQARLQAYLLDKNGYSDLYIVNHIGYKSAHSILFYRNPVTQKMNMIDNTMGKIYNLNGETNDFIELYDQIYPGWFTLIIEDKEAKGLFAIDCQNKWFIEDWFNE